MSLKKKIRSAIDKFTMHRGFDARWYNHQYPGVGPALLRYATNGDREGYRPNPLFSTVWYKSHYPDVALSGVPALRHYLQYGWREGRSPSGFFDSGWYLRDNPDVAAAGLEPLQHYLTCGMKEGRRGHPSLAAHNQRTPKVAVVVVSFNAPEYLRITLKSLRRAKTRTPFSIFLVENGSGRDCKTAVQDMVTKYSDLDIRFFNHPENTGFSGGNNIGIRSALSEDYSHICLLNSDVICTTGWLDLLLDTGEPVVGPVSNAVGNEQTIHIDYSATTQSDAFEQVDAFAVRWRQTLVPKTVSTTFLGFFCVLLDRSVVEQVGLLDEQFFPGSYEDDDYCLRIAQSGYNLSIARHVYLHHFGSASFGKLDLSDRLQISDDNRLRFERKWERIWSDRSHLPILSGAQDAERLNPNTPAEKLLKNILVRQAGDYSKLTEDLMMAVAHYRREILAKNSQLDAQLTTIQEKEVQIEKSEARALALQDLVDQARRDLQIEPADADAEIRVNDKIITAYGAPTVSLSQAAPQYFRECYADILFGAWKYLVEARFCSLDVMNGLQPIIYGLAEMCSLGAPTLLFANNSDPVTGDERDGYQQRVRAIDAILSKSGRVYVKFDPQRRSNPILHVLSDGVWRLEIADEDPLGNALLKGLLERSGNIYAHSVFGFETRTSREIAQACRGHIVLDLHGSVPEEFEMYEDPFSAQIFNGHEAAAAKLISHLVCVSARMAQHFVGKHGALPNPPVICPIFVPATPPENKAYRKRPRVIYAGGLQKWQQTSKMVDLISDVEAVADFILLTPQPDLMSAELRAGGVDPGSGGLCLKQASHAEVLETYLRCDFGLLLRAPSVVNRVSCPTKLVEYLTFGVVPILDSDEIGDFVDLGMRFVDLEAFRRGDIPDRAERRRMALVNYGVLEELRRLSLEGQERISDIFSSHQNPMVVAA